MLTRIPQSLIAASILAAGCATPPQEMHRARFLQFCDLAVSELNKEITPFRDRADDDPSTHHMPFFEDAHAVRALAAAYDMTGRKAYLDACRKWSDLMVRYQSGMIPAGAYYMNHSRAPGQDTGQWNLADSGSVGQGVLATAVRCSEPAERGRYLASVEWLAKLAIENYVTPSGGITNGCWPEHDGPWWCSSATFGTLSLLLYEATGNPQYRRVGVNAMRWLAARDFRELAPITFQQRSSGTIFYVFDLYATGLRHLEPDDPARASILRQWEAALSWMAAHQKTRGADVPDYTVRNVDMAGLPCLVYAFARQVPVDAAHIAAADAELTYIGDLLLRDGRPNVSKLMVWEVMTWGMLSYAERLAPGAMARGLRPG